MARTKLGALLDTVDATKTAPPEDAAPEAAPAPAPAPEPAAPARAEAAVPAGPDQADDAKAASSAGEGRKAPSAPGPQRSTPRRPAAAETAANGAGPRYLELVRKEARFTDAQLDELTVLTRQLNKARRGEGERITDNTLIRVAVDLLLRHRDELAGTTEEELRASVGL